VGVYNILGQRLEGKESGSGVYFYEIERSKGILKKVLVVR
jgi:hypothetical protein